MKRILLIFNIIILTAPSYSQTGGNNVYEFLNLTHSGLVTSIGGMNVSLLTNDLNLAYHNPALLNQGMNRMLALNYVNYFAGINYGLAMYSQTIKSAGNFAAGLAYLNYGSFTEADASGVVTGSFRAAEYAFSLIYSREIDSVFSFGVNLKPVISNLERYSSYGFAFDIGASYHSRDNLFSAGLVIRNAGLQVKSYAGEVRQNLPFEIQAGASGKLAYAPLRFSLTLRHLEKFDLSHDYNETTLTNNTKTSSGFGDNALRHIIIGAELMPHKNFYFGAGYNFQRRKEMQTAARGSAAGLTWGFGINTAWVNVEFGRAIYHLAGSSTNISLVLRPENIYRKSRLKDNG